MTKRYKPKKLALVEVLVVVFVCLFLLAVVPPSCNKTRSEAMRRTTCGKNMSDIGKAMLVYANDYDGELPRAGGRNSVWSGLVGWDTVDRFEAFGLYRDGSGGRATISSSLYLLVKYVGVAPKTFVCPSDTGTTEFKTADYGADDRELIDLWDFGPDPKHCSYAYQMPYCLYRLTTSSEPGMAVVADRNPWIDSPAGEAKNMAGFNPDGGEEAVKIGNAVSHQEDGQNVLFLDGHVSFEKHTFCGINNDNIYTFWDGGDIRRGGLPIPGLSAPQDRLDSLLVNDPTLTRITTKSTHAEMESRAELKARAKDLKHTIVTPHLDVGIERGMNVLWCNTFQLAWNEFCELAGGPITMERAPPMVAVLNKRTASKGDLDQASYVAMAGLAREGIYGKIRKQLEEKFQGQAAPELFDSIPPMDWISYAYLSKALPFEWAFTRFHNNLCFEGYYVDSFGIKQLMDFDTAELRMASQVLILDHRSSDDFIVELKTKAKDDRLILAKVPPQTTLGDTVKTIERRIVNAKPVKIGPASDLYIPILNFDILRVYSELYEHRIKTSDKRIDGTNIAYAAQSVRFRLDETGAVLKSEAAIAPAGGRKLIFDKPFLILLKRHEANNPYFALWVGNAELLIPVEKKGVERTVQLIDNSGRLLF